MDRLTALAIAELRLRLARLRLDLIQRFPHLLENDMPTPKLQGLTKAMDMLEHDLESGAGELLTKIEGLGARGKAALVKGHQRIDGLAGRVAEVEKFVTVIEGSNGGAPLDDSSTLSEGSLPNTDGSSRPADQATAEPAASWAPKSA